MSQSTFEQRRKLLQLEALYDVGRALNTLRPEDELLEELMHRSMSILDASVGFVFSVDENFQLQHLFGVGFEAGDAFDQLLDQRPIRELIASRQSVVRSLHPLFDLAPAALVVTPMLAGETFIGGIAVFGKEARDASESSFSEDDVRFLESLGAIGAAAIDNTRNYHRLELMRESLEDENRSLRQRMLRDYSDRMMIGDSPAMQRVMDLIARVSNSHASVLIRGESGTGKEMVARLLHGNSPRRDKPFVAINCAALPETLLESELFGIERGVATGVEARPGRFELASGGTIFLDEIGDMPVNLQAKLLRVIQEREIEKLGGRRRIPVDVRILTATHRDLERMIEQREFRQDLYYRLRVIEIMLPPLRERQEDIPKLARYFVDKYGKREGLDQVRITQGALQKLMRYPFPGNVRELENLIEAALAMRSGPVIDEGEILLGGEEGGPDVLELGDELPPLGELQRRYIEKVLAYTGGNVSRAARILGVDRKTLYRRRAEMSQNTTHVPLWDIQ
jgi:two-component system, NtrC family, response regulator HydG